MARWEQQVAVVFVMCFVGMDLATSLKLPSYIIPCSRSDPKFSECATKNGNLGKMHVLKGDKKYHFPVMDPIKVSSLVIDDSAGPVGLYISMKDMEMRGFQDTDIQNVIMDTEKNVVTFFGSVPAIEFSGSYNMSGKILILPIAGSGSCNFTFQKFKFDYKIYYDLYKKPNGVEYAKILTSKSKFTFTYDTVSLTFENLFNGNKALGDQMAAFIDENAQLLVSEMGPSFSSAISSVFLTGFSYLTDRVPFDEIFLP